MCLIILYFIYFINWKKPGNLKPMSLTELAVLAHLKGTAPLSDFRNFWWGRNRAGSLQPTASSLRPASLCRENTICKPELNMYYAFIHTVIKLIPPCFHQHAVVYAEHSLQQLMLIHPLQTKRPVYFIKTKHFIYFAVGFRERNMLSYIISVDLDVTWCPICIKSYKPSLWPMKNVRSPDDYLGHKWTQHVILVYLYISVSQTFTLGKQYRFVFFYLRKHVSLPVIFGISSSFGDC